ncbi:aldo/keto reductase [Klugiella xanthotipulae]|uniref:Diketogulonate reductase-like aldo/keto reductase n=1 Tax=Klugiella xanthotipulae TaxID=244735 RepID=A0A543I4B5_9MICO|nr:aldo/keto reductase [Klugiella xanthotipulae]TQM65433.1 diketogulonate reductase-like aldo/keto reductase [Klugiella xanthotipulae]
MSVHLPRYALNDGNSLPQIGFGTYPLLGEAGVTAIQSAIDAGYTLIDTAVNYQNEGAVGEAIRRSGVDRAALQVATKLPGRYHEFNSAIDSAHESLWRLGLEYVDLYVIHWPNPAVGNYVEAWRALIRLQEEGLARSIGVSNFTAEHLGRIIEQTGIRPAVNQVELHPYFPQVELRAVHAELGIQTESWSPLGKRKAPYGERVIVEAARAHEVTPAQVILRWQTQIGSLPIPKSATPERQRQNLDLFGFELSEGEIAAITALGRPDGRLFGGDPDTHEEQ